MQEKISSKRNWAMVLLGGSFFLYAFMLANIMAPLQATLMKFFGATPKEIGVASSWFFLSNIIFILPAGLILDRFPIRFLMLINMLLAIIGTMIFAFADSLQMVAVGRFLSGIIMAFGIIICVKFASLWLPAKKMALATAFLVMIGMIGGMLAQAPIASLINEMGWRATLLLIASFGMVIALFLGLIIKEPKTREKQIDIEQHISIFRSLKEVFQKSINWQAGLFISFLNFPIAILGALYGSIFLEQAYNISKMEASSIVSMLFLGMFLGSPFFGWFSDIIKSKKIPMLLGSIGCLILILSVLVGFDLPGSVLHLLFFLIGFTSSVQVLGYPIITENNHPEISGTALSMATFLIMVLGYCLSLPFIGWILEIGWKGKIIDGVQVFSKGAYQEGFLIIVIALVISVLLAWKMPAKKREETL